MPECFYLILFFGICSRLLKIYRPDYTFCSPWEVNFFLSAKVLVSLKYKNILHFQDVISILDTLKYFNILSLLQQMYCIHSPSLLGQDSQGTSTNFHIFLMYDKYVFEEGMRDGKSSLLRYL